MRSLAVKLTLAFVLVGMIGIAVVSLVVRAYTQREFNRLVLDQNQQAVLANLIRYYEANGSWRGVERVFRPGTQIEVGVIGPGIWRWEERRTLFVIANQAGEVIFGENPRFAGKTLTSSQLRLGVPIQADGDTVGYLIFTPALDRWDPGTLEGQFLLGVQRAIRFSALAAVGVALVLGGILAYTLTRSLRELTAATQEVARGRLGTQVEVRSEDELGQLAESFNQMSTDLAHSVELRRKMTADIAHDLRTPLSVILGYTEALSDGKLSPDAEMFEVMHTEAQHLNHLIDDLKVLSLAEAGELPLSPQPVQPGKLVGRAAEAHRIQAGEKGIALKTEVEPDLPDLMVDVERMAQVLGNLMSNALRFTPQGGQIVLSAGQAGGEVTLAVADSGQGIPAEDLPYIFERSFRGDKARSPSGESGLGLAIARSLVEAQGGRIQVESTVGQGTKFTVFLPRG